MPDRFFAEGCPSSGLITKGNIDIFKRPSVKTPGGKTASVFSMVSGFRIKGREVSVVLPRVVGGRIVSEKAAENAYINTGKHLGIFKTPQQAVAYAICLHKQQARLGQQGGG